MGYRIPIRQMPSGILFSQRTTALLAKKKFANPFFAYLDLLHYYINFVLFPQTINFLNTQQAPNKLNNYHLP